MVSEYESAQDFDEDEETYQQPRSRRRLRGLHWRHASQSRPIQQPAQYSTQQLRPLSINMSESGFGSFMTDSPSNHSTTPATISSNGNLEFSATTESYSAFSESFANELSRAFNIDEDPQVEQLESSLREKNQRLSMQANELEMLSQRIKEAEERLRRVEEENEESSVGRPTPPITPVKPSLSYEAQMMAETRQHDDNEDEMRK